MSSLTIVWLLILILTIESQSTQTKSRQRKTESSLLKKIFERLKNDNETENTEHFSSTKIESERNESSFHTVRFCDNQVQSYGRGTNNRLIVIREGVWGLRVFVLNQHPYLHIFCGSLTRRSSGFLLSAITPYRPLIQRRHVTNREVEFIVF